MGSHIISKPSKFHEFECGHIYLDTHKERGSKFDTPFSKNISVDTHTEYTAIKSGYRANSPEVTIDVSKTLFDKEEASNEETP